jgi:hypothetical protein
MHAQRHLKSATRLPNRTVFLIACGNCVDPVLPPFVFFFQQGAAPKDLEASIYLFYYILKAQYGGLKQRHHVDPHH